MLASGDREFLEEMELAQVAPDRWEGRLTERFNAPVQPQGGITTALALRAAASSLGRPDQQVRSVTTVFAAQVLPGDVVVDVEVMREGRGASQVQATVRSVDGDAAGHRVVATFVTGRASEIAFTDVAPPAAPLPEECRNRWDDEGPLHPEMVGPRPTFFGHFETRSVSGHVPWDPPWDPTSSEVVTWMRWHDTPRDEAGHISVLGLVPPCDTMPPAVFERHGPDDRFFLVPSVDLTVQVFDTRLDADGWMLRRNRSRWAGAGLAAAEMELFAADGRPLAYATQLMHVRVADAERIRARLAEAAGEG